MATPKAGALIRADETEEGAKDDIFGTFREMLGEKVEAKVQHHLANVTNESLEFKRVGVNDQNYNPIPEGFGGAMVVDGVPYFFEKHDNLLSMADIFAEDTVIQLNDGFIDRSEGDTIDGQISYWDVNEGGGMDESSIEDTIVTSVAHQIYLQARTLTKSRNSDINERLAVTSKDWVSKTWPATFEGYTIQNKGDTLYSLEELYVYGTNNRKGGVTSMAEPFISAVEWDLWSEGVYGDPLRTKIQDLAETAIDGADPHGALIEASVLNDVYARYVSKINPESSEAARVVVDYCHSSCHASCHSSRSRR